MSRIVRRAAVFAVVLAIVGAADIAAAASAPDPFSSETRLTNPDRTALFEKQAGLVFRSIESSGPVIAVDESRTFQTMDGFGYALTGGSARLLRRMSAAARASLIKEIFSTGGDGLGVSYLRISVGASDLDDRPFSYDDPPGGGPDPRLSRFSLAPDRAALIPILKEILAAAPGLKILASPWSPPAWMKTNHGTKGGSLKPEFYDAYARYLVKYVQGMAAEGVRIEAITVQNEPLNPDNNPSLLMFAREQAEFIKNHLGPAFLAAHIATKIVCYDHNADRIDYPLDVLGDAEARKYVDGSAFHLYGGSISDLAKVHDAYPDKSLYFTEQWVGAPADFAAEVGWHVENLIIGATRNWCRVVLEWNLASSPDFKPHTADGGCTNCLGAVTIDGDEVTRNPAYYVVAHASKFVRPGSTRIASNVPERLDNVAFRTPEGRVVLIVRNDDPARRSFGVRYGGKTAAAALNGGAVGTYVWLSAR